MSITRDVVNPSDEQVITQIQLFELEEVDAAIERAAVAQRAWAALAPGDRARLLRRAAAAVDGAREELALLRSATPGTRFRTPAGRRAMSGTCSTTTPAHPSGSSAARFLWAAASTSLSGSRSASSA